MRLILLVVACAMCGCAATVASSSARTVVIKASRDRVAEAQALADAECAKHKRSARLIKAPRPYEPDFIFDCLD